MPAHEFPDDDTVDGHDSVEVRRVQPYDAIKAYRCPGCNQEIRVGESHVVVVPLRAPGDRRHWHHSCWEREERNAQPRS